MRIHNLQGISSFNFPRFIPSNQSIVEFLEEYFKVYLNEIETDKITKYNGGEYITNTEMIEIIEHATIISRNVHNVIKENYYGHNYSAINELFSTLDKYEKDILNLCANSGAKFPPIPA